MTNRNENPMPGTPAPHVTDRWTERETGGIRTESPKYIDLTRDPFPFPGKTGDEPPTA